MMTLRNMRENGVRSRAAIAIGGLQMRNLMWEFLIAMVFLVGTFLLLGGELFFGHLFSVPSVAIGIGGVLCVLATIAKERIDRDMTRHDDPRQHAPERCALAGDHLRGGLVSPLRNHGRERLSR